MDGAQLMDEIKEDVRVEQIVTFVKTYANQLICGVLALFLGTGGYIYWAHKSHETALSLAQTYARSVDLIAKKTIPEAVELLDVLSKDQTVGYGVLAAFQKAAMADISLSDRVDALVSLEKNTKADSKFRELAAILRSYMTFDTLSYKTAKESLEPISAGTSPFRASAREILAWLLIKDGRIDESRALLKNLAEDAMAPASLRGRAFLLLDPSGLNQ